jgi:hypothetical protein
VPVIDRYQVLRGLLYDLAAMTTTDHTNVFPHIRDGLLDCVRVCLLDLLPLPRIGEPPSSRYGLRCAEYAVDPTTTTTVRTGPPKPPSGLWMAAFHERDEVLAAHRRVGLDTEPFERLRGRQPPARSLSQLAIWGEVVVAALRRDGLSLQISGVVAATRRRYARCTHHIAIDREHRRNGHRLRHTVVTQRLDACASGLQRRL